VIVGTEKTGAAVARPVANGTERIRKPIQFQRVPWCNAAVNYTGDGKMLKATLISAIWFADALLNRGEG